MTSPLFTEIIPVSETEVENWLDSISTLSATQSRRQMYRKAYRVDDKIRAYKRLGIPLPSKDFP